MSPERVLEERREDAGNAIPPILSEDAQRQQNPRDAEFDFLFENSSPEQQRDTEIQRIQSNLFRRRNAVSIQ